MKNNSKTSKCAIIAILTFCLLFCISGTQVFAAMAEGTTVAIEENIVAAENTTPELVPMMASMCGYTSVNQMMMMMVTRGQAPNGVVAVHNAHVPGGQPHVHFTVGALNIDGTTHDGISPTLTNAQRNWLQSNGWGAN